MICLPVKKTTCSLSLKIIPVMLEGLFMRSFNVTLREVHADNAMMIVHLHVDVGTHVSLAAITVLE